MADQQAPAAVPTSGNLKNELRVSLGQLKKDFDALRNFVTEIAQADATAPMAIGKGDLNDLIAITLDIQDAANDLGFEAGKIKETLQNLAL